MKPFITDAIQGGKYVLPFQIEGISADQVLTVFRKARVLSYSLPPSQTTRAAWLLRLALDTGWIADFSSACTGIGGWQEVGSLNIGFSPEQPKGDAVSWVVTPVADFHIEAVEQLIYEDADVYAECGIVLSDARRNELVISTGTAPGSVSVSAFFLADALQPEFELIHLQRRSL